MVTLERLNEKLDYSIKLQEYQLALSTAIYQELTNSSDKAFTKNMMAGYITNLWQTIMEDNTGRNLFNKKL